MATIVWFQTIISCCLVFGLSSPCLVAQEMDTIFSLSAQIKIETNTFTTDKLQQIYVVSTGNELIKYNLEGNPIFKFNNNTLGDLKLVDVTDPFNILLYYSDFQTAITLDRTLSQTGEINFIELNYVNVPTIATAIDNNIWLYDEINFQLKKIDRNGNVLSTSEDLNLLLGQAPQPKQIVARENFVFINDAVHGLLLFNNFGQYIKSLGIREADYFQVIDNKIVYVQNQQMLTFDLQSLFINVVGLPKGISLEYPVRIEKNRIYSMNAKGIKVFSY